MPALNELSATDVVHGIAAGTFTAEAVVRACLDRIAGREPVVQAWSYIDPDLALAQARALDKGPRRGPLHGLPIGIKDVIDTVDQPTCMGSPIYEGYRAPCDAASVAFVRAAGAVILGKTVTAEFAGMAPGPTTNPHNAAHTPGGSSSGSGAAVADFMVPAGFGTQTGGSIVRPAAYCGVVGYKPTYNLINRAGLKFAAEGLDTIGVLTRTIEDAELITAVMVGKPLAPSHAPDRSPRIGVCRTPLWETALPETVHAVEDAARRLSAAGAKVHDVTLPEEFTRLYHAARETINNYERARAMAGDWATNGDRVSKVLGDRIREGMVMSYADYRAALALGEECRARINVEFADLDVILAPSVKGEAPLGLATTGEPAFQAFWTILHVPTITLPTHRGPTGLPVGIQLIAPRYEDDRLFSCAQWVLAKLGRA